MESSSRQIAERRSMYKVGGCCMGLLYCNNALLVQGRKGVVAGDMKMDIPS